MRICTNCYKKLYYQRFTPYDYRLKDGQWISACCESETIAISDGRQYRQKVKELKEKKALLEWQR